MAGFMVGDNKDGFSSYGRSRVYVPLATTLAQWESDN